jgi:hypothetical protein
VQATEQQESAAIFSDKKWMAPARDDETLKTFRNYAEIWT